MPGVAALIVPPPVRIVNPFNSAAVKVTSLVLSVRTPEIVAPLISPSATSALGAPLPRTVEPAASPSGASNES